MGWHWTTASFEASQRLMRLSGTTNSTLGSLTRAVHRASGCRAGLSTGSAATSGSGIDREAVRHRYREALRLSRRADAAASPSTATLPTAASSVGSGTIRERRGKSRHGGVWWPDDELENVESPAVVTPEQRWANRQRYTSAISSSRASATQESDSMHSKPTGFGFNAIMSELDQLAGRDSHYPLFERSVFDQHRARKAALASEAARSASTGPLHDDSGGLYLGPSDSDRHDRSVGQRRDYWPAMELQALRDARAEIMLDSFGPTGSDSGDWCEATWDSISGWLAMQGYNRSGPECAAASAADIAALAQRSSALGDSGRTQHAADATESQSNAQNSEAAEQQALLERHSEETLRLVDKSAATGRLRPILSEADVAMIAKLQDGAATALVAAVDAAVANTARAGVPSVFAADNDFSARTAKQSTLAARVEAVAGTIVRQSGLLERESEARVLLLAVLASEHVLIFGPPGTGKTTLCRQVASVFGADINSSSSTHSPMRLFERLVTRFSVPEELLGPLSLSALCEDTHTRLTDGYLGTANIALLDEIFKASSSLLNSLLEILADRHTTEGGSAPVRSPLVCMMGTAGTLPDEARPGGELAALFDRFLLRMTMQPLSLAGRMQLVQSPLSEALAAGGGGTGGAAIFSAPEAAKIRENSVDVALPDSVMAILEETAAMEARRSSTDVQNDSQPGSRPAPAIGYVSDRRLVACASLLRIIAYTSGRAVVHPLDCLLLRHCLPHDADASAAAVRLTEEMLVACAVPTSAAEELRAGVELQKRMLTHLATAPSRSPAHGSSRDWRLRPAGVLAASVGPGSAGNSPGASTASDSASPVQQHLKVLTGLHQQIDVQVQRMTRSTSELQVVYEEARAVLLSHPWLSLVERDALAAQMKKIVATHVDEVHRVCAELLTIDLWLGNTLRGSGALDIASAPAKQHALVGSALPPLLSLMPQATASVLRELLASSSSPDEQRSALRLVQIGGFHAHMIAGGAAPRVQTYSNPKQRGAIEMWASPHGGGIP